MRRLPPDKFLGTILWLGLSVGVLSGCGSEDLSVSTPDVGKAEAAACAQLVDALPDMVSDQARREVQGTRGRAAAWGDPAIVLRCGVDTPRGFDKFAACQETNGVGWFVPEEQFEDQGVDVLMTTIGFEQNIEVRVPAEHRPPAAAMVDLAAPIKRSIREVEPCL